MGIYNLIICRKKSTGGLTGMVKPPKSLCLEADHR